MEDRYINSNESLNRLKNEYSKYNSLLIAFDFDNTVFDFHKTGDTYPAVEELLRKSKQKGCKLILFTANEGEVLDKAVQYCTERGYAPDFVNESPVMDTRKPFYNLLLDDRAGLCEAAELISNVLDSVKQE